MAPPLAKKLVAAALALSAGGVAFISSNEGRMLQAYRDPVGVVTICDGHTKTAKIGQTATNAICNDLLRQDTTEAQKAVQRLVTAQVTQAQYDALVDFTFNVGAGNLASSTLLKRVNASDCRGAGAEFPKWNKAKGQVLPGLVKRREAERVMWLTGC